MLIKPIQIVLDEAGNQIDLNYRPVRSHTQYRHILQIVAPNLATEAVDVTISTYGKEILSESTRTRLAVDSNGTYLKGSAVVDEDETYYSAVSQYNVWEVELVGPIASILQKVNSSKVAIVVSFSMPVVDARALVSEGSFGSLGDLPTITDEIDGDYRTCDSLAYTSTLISTEFKYNDIAIVSSGAWIKGKVFRMIQTCPMIQISVDPSLALIYDEPTDELATVLIDDVSRVDGIVSDVQTKVNNIESDNLNLNNDITNLEDKDIIHEGRLDDLEAKDILLDADIVADRARLTQNESDIDALESADTAQDSRIDTLESEIDLNTAKISFNSTASSKLNGIENGATQDQTPLEIKQAYESNSNTNAFTDAEKAKVASLDGSKFLGTYVNLEALESAHPSPVAGNFAHVDAGAGAEVTVYIWDASDVKFVAQAGAGTIETAASIKTKYESNADTNVLTDAEKLEIAANTLKISFDSISSTKLGTIEEGAEVNDVNTTLEGNTFNGNSQLVKTTSEGKLPAIDGSLLTNLPGSAAAVSSVNTKTGIVVLDSDDIDEGLSNLYYTEARVNANAAVAANTAKISFDSTSSTKLGTIEEGAEVNVSLASQAEAEAGTEATKTMTPLTTAQAIAAQVPAETVTSLSLTTNVLTYTDEDGTDTDIDLSLYLDDTNLAQIISGVYDSGTTSLIFTRSDDSTFSVDASMFFDDTNLVTSINTKTGIVILDTDDISEGGTNKFYTEVRVAANSAVVANTAKVGITTQQASDISANNDKISFDSTSSTKLGTIEEGAEVNVPAVEYTATISIDTWTGSVAPFTKAVTVSGIVAGDKPIIDLDLSSATYANVADIQADWANIYRGVTSTDTITFYTSEVPTIAIPITIKVVD